MAFGLGGMPGRASSKRGKDRVAKLLQINPSAIGQFEKAYEARVLSEEPDPRDPFGTSARQASAKIKAGAPDADPAVDMEAHAAMLDKIARALASATPVWSYDREAGVPPASTKALPEPSGVTRDELLALPERLRPQLTELLVKKDLDESTGGTLLSLYADAVDPSLPDRKRRQAYNLFRQGLDILDLDGLSYAMLGTNPNAMSKWLPALVRANEGLGFFRIPSTRIARVPLPVLQLSRLDYDGLTPATLSVVDDWARRAFDLEPGGDYFVKTGTWSSKFDFRNAHVHGEKEVQELGEYLLYIQHQACSMACPGSVPSVYGASTTNEWVVREFVPDPDGDPTIYKGLPLRTEYRVFVDCDRDAVLGVVPYWNPDAMETRFSSGPDAGSPHMAHDYVAYKAHEPVLMARYEANEDRVAQEVGRLLPRLDLSSQWSIDVMQSGDGFWLIDMARAQDSAFYEKAVPTALRRPSNENWIPALPGADD